MFPMRCAVQRRAVGVSVRVLTVCGETCVLWGHSKTVLGKGNVPALTGQWCCQNRAGSQAWLVHTHLSWNILTAQKKGRLI